MANLPWFKVYAAETLSDERFQGWTVDERGAWFTLLLTAWREGSIPGDMASLARLLHVDASAMRSLWSAIGDRFIPHPDVPGRLTSPRLEMEREDAEKLREKKSEAGKKGATSRWETEKKRHSKRMRVPCANGAAPMANDSDKPSQAQISTEPASQEGRVGETDLAVFRSSLGERLGLGRMVEIGNHPQAIPVFRKQLAAVGDEQLLVECCDLAAKSTSGVPSTLSWFVGWLSRLPVPQEARQ